ncbi:MAG: response regulator [Burkholderiales bacterium]|jgi:DNA-binding NtrC family response regulator|nr:response regulator [Burkholderiales bacterium]
MAARLLLIEDDASIARFVELALEEMPGHDATAPAVELSLVRCLADARTALAAGGWQLVISDLMLPDGSAEALLAEGHALAAGAPPWVIFSAGLDEQRHAALALQGAARTLRKPVPLAELLDTVAGLLRGAAAAAVAEVPGDDPVQRHFGGDRAMYESFRDGCIARFADDLAQGDAAVAGGDAAALRRVAHGLKAVLELIGQPGLADQARMLENAAAACAPGQLPAAGWGGLAQGLVDLGARRRR